MDAEDPLSNHPPNEEIEFNKQDALEAALLEGIRSPHRVYGEHVLDEIRKATQ